MTHFMNLHPAPFEKVARGEKDIELRLQDEKRKRIRVGDVIVFRKTGSPLAYLFCEVKALHPYPTFEELFAHVDPMRCGYAPGEKLTMEGYYPKENELRYGALGIEIGVKAPSSKETSLDGDAGAILTAALEAAMPDTAVKTALVSMPDTQGELVLVAIGKAAWQMAFAAYEVLGEKISRGMVITKHGHSMGRIGKLIIREAGHPVPDGHTYAATEEALAMTENLTDKDRVLFLISGGGSALFEKPLLPAKEMEEITRALLACGADITEVNTLRKRFSAVKGGKFARHVSPAKVFSVILSDVLGDPIDMIASGPAYPDSATAAEAVAIAEKYALPLSKAAWDLLKEETPKELPGVETLVTGSVKVLCEAAEKACKGLGYETAVLTDTLNCEAKDAGATFASLAREHAGKGKKAFIAGGETVVKLVGNGLGGRNQEMALAAAIGMEGLEKVAFFSLGSDGTDGPTDAAGGIINGNTAELMRSRGLDPKAVLENNDAFHGLLAAGGLLFTGPTGTNVNDISVLLIGE
ncbi:MAG: DUF4147 domain-containing protein [Clostridia bacterium]|nr:DUF4147 domain-containing protein [Clostridia bacterium]